MKECKISKYLSVKKVLGAKNFKRDKMIQNGTIINNKFIDKDTYFTKEEDSDEEKNHFIDFEIPIFLKDISSFFKNIDIIHYGEFNILLDLIDELFVSN